MMFGPLAHALSPMGRGSRLSILIFHRVHSQPDPLFPGEPDIQRFNTIIGWINRWFNVIPLDTAVRQLPAANLPARAVCITFDDGYADNVVNALPVLQHHKVPATFFVSTAFLDGGRMWNDSVIEAFRHCRHRVFDGRLFGMGIFALETLEQRRHAMEAVLAHTKYMAPTQRQDTVAQLVEWAATPLPDDLMMRSEQVLALRNANMQIGAHTVSHPILANISNAQARWEIASSKSALQTLLGQPVTLFAYPNGKPTTDYGERHVNMVRNAGFEAAVSTIPGAAVVGTDVLQLPRFTPWDRNRLRFATRLLINR